MRLKQYRTGIMVLVIMLALNLFIPNIMPLADERSAFTPLLEENFKFGDKVDKVVLEGMINHIAKSDGYKIVFIGDSVVAGATVKDKSNTIPAQFGEEVRKRFPKESIRVYNLGMPGNRPTDIYFTMKKLQRSKAANLIIMNVNYAFFSDEMLKKDPIARPDLYTDLMDKNSSEKLGLKYSAVEGWLKKNVASKWSLYDMREEISFYLFGRNPREILTGFRPGNTLNVIASLLPGSKAGTQAPGGKRDAKAPDVKSVRDDPNLNWKKNRPFAADMIEHWVQVFNIEKMGLDNIGFWFLNKTAKDIDEQKINAVVFFTPVNSAMVEEYNLMKHGEHYYENMQKMKRLFTDRGIRTYTYTRSIHSDLFHDLFHMGPVGNKQLAGLILDDMDDMIAKGLES